MGEIVNLRRVRKAKARDADAARAAENRARSGQTKAERKAAAQERDVSNRTLDMARIDPERP